MLIKAWEIGFPEKSKVTAALYDDGSFILSGEGDVVKFISDEQIPWKDYRSKINSVHFGHSIKPESIGNWFWGCENLSVVENLPDGLKYMPAAFCNCSSLSSLPEIPESVTDLDEAFIRCRSLKEFPVIPANVIYTCDTFVGCCALSGNMLLKAPLQQYNFMFQDACTDASSELIIDFAPGLEEIVDAIIATASDGSHICKGRCIVSC